jgi:hypothetical protein
MKNLELIILVILVCWVGISYVIAHIGGWFRLARFYRFSGAFLGERWRFQSAQMRWKVGYNNCLTVGASPEGLYLSVMFILRFGHPPLFVPWSDISVNVAEPSEAYPMTLLRSFEGYPLRIHPRSETPWLSAQEGKSEWSLSNPTLKADGKQTL